MKRIVLFVCFSSLLLHFCLAYTGQWKRGTSVFKDGIELVAPTGPRKLIPFATKDEPLRIGFFQNNSCTEIVVPPIYDDSYFNGYLLFGIEQNGKWGIIDLGGRFYDKTGTHKWDFRKPLIPCVHDHIDIVDDFVVICDGKTIDVRNLGYDMF